MCATEYFFCKIERYLFFNYSIRESLVPIPFKIPLSTNMIIFFCVAPKIKHKQKHTIQDATYSRPEAPHEIRSEASVKWQTSTMTPSAPPAEATRKSVMRLS